MVINSRPHVTFHFFFFFRRSLESVTGTFTFNCVFQPSFVAESKNILVFENFYYTSSAIGVKPLVSASNASEKVSFPLVTSPAEIKTAADKICGTLVLK